MSRGIGREDGVSVPPRHEQVKGYCVRCGQYTLGELVDQLNAYAESIRNHLDCRPDSRPSHMRRTDR